MDNLITAIAALLAAIFMFRCMSLYRRSWFVMAFGALALLYNAWCQFAVVIGLNHWIGNGWYEFASSWMTLAMLLGAWLMLIRRGAQ